MVYMKTITCKSRFQFQCWLVSALLLLLLIPVLGISAQKSSLDTLYYNKDWKGVSNRAFASFYRVLDLSDKATQKKTSGIITSLESYNLKEGISV